MKKNHRLRKALPSETHEPSIPLPNWPKSHVWVELTGAETFECICVVIHGVRHYLHATTARELSSFLTESLDEYNRSVQEVEAILGIELPHV